MPKKKKEFTHQLIEIPNPDGTYVNPDGVRINFHKFGIEQNVSTRHKVHKGTTIKQFLEDNKGYKTAN